MTRKAVGLNRIWAMTRGKTQAISLIYSSQVAFWSGLVAEAFWSARAGHARSEREKALASDRAASSLAPALPESTSKSASVLSQCHRMLASPSANEQASALEAALVPASPSELELALA